MKYNSVKQPYKRPDASEPIYMCLTALADSNTERIEDDGNELPWD